MATDDRIHSRVAATPGCDCGCSTTPPRLLVTALMPPLAAFLLVALPKCPLCLLAWLGLLGSVGVDSWVSDIWGAPVAIGLVGIAVVALAVRARRTRSRRPLALGLLGSAALLTGKCLTAAPPLVYAGLGLLIFASVWRDRSVSVPTMPVRVDTD